MTEISRCMYEPDARKAQRKLTFTWHFKEKFARGSGLLIHMLIFSNTVAGNVLDNSTFVINFIKETIESQGTYDERFDRV